MSFASSVVSWARRKSPWIIHFNTGACNACDIEIVAALTPRFDVESVRAAWDGDKLGPLIPPPFRTLGRSNLGRTSS